MIDETPALSVVVPVRNDPENLRLCLSGLARSSFQNFEVIVVDDASDDSTPEVAQQCGATVLVQERRQGPGVARNRGVEIAEAPVVLFVDADVVVGRDTLAMVVKCFDDDPVLDAVFGSYDDCPRAPNFISQYRNLVHRYFHQMSAGPASTFWAGCGAIRRRVFDQIGGFRSSFDRPSIEDIELGARLAGCGGRILLHPDIEVTHLKQWRFRPMVVCDFLYRGIPWTREVLRSGSIPNTLNLALSQRWSAVAAVALVTVWLVSACLAPFLVLVPPAILLGVVAVDRLAVRGIGHRSGKLLVLALCLATTLLIVFLGSGSPVVVWWAVSSLALISLIIAINRRYYGFFMRARGAVFTGLVVPLHILYYLYSSAAFLIGSIQHRLSSSAGGRAPSGCVKSRDR